MAGGSAGGCWDRKEREWEWSPRVLAAAAAVAAGQAMATAMALALARCLASAVARDRWILLTRARGVAASGQCCRHHCQLRWHLQAAAAAAAVRLRWMLWRPVLALLAVVSARC